MGSQKALKHNYQAYRHATVEYMGRKLLQRSIPHARPMGGDAVFLDAKALLTYVPVQRYMSPRPAE